MSGFGIDPFSQFADEGDATEDPFGIAASARETQWWTPWAPYGTDPRRKKKGLNGWNQDGPPPSSVAPPPSAMTPSPSTTQRVILDQKQGQEDVTRLFGGAAPRDTGAGGGDFDLGGGGVLKYQAPDPTNPGQQDQARASTVDNAAMDEWRAAMKKAKELEDKALALPNRSGFWGTYDEQRARLFENARVLRNQAAYARASVPDSASYDPQRYKTVGNLVFDSAKGQYVVPDENTMAAMHRSGLTPRTGAAPAPHLETLVNPRTGQTVRVDQAAVPRNAQGELVYRYFQRDPRLQGPTQPGVDSLGETKEEPYGVPEPAAVQAAQFRADNPAPEKAPKEPSVNPLTFVREKQKIRADAEEQIRNITQPERGSFWDSPKNKPGADAAIKKIQQAMQDKLDELDSTASPSGGGKPQTKGPAAGGGGGIPDKAIAVIKAAGGKPVPFKNGKTYVWKNGAPQEVK